MSLAYRPFGIAMRLFSKARSTSKPFRRTRPNTRPIATNDNVGIHTNQHIAYLFPRLSFLHVSSFLFFLVLFAHHLFIVSELDRDRLDISLLDESRSEDSDVAAKSRGKLCRDLEAAEKKDIGERARGAGCTDYPFI